MKIDKSELFKTAWEIAKKAAVQFKDNAKIFFGESLKQAWRHLKNMTDVNIENLRKLGREWKIDNYHRIYFNNIQELLGMIIERKRGRYYINGQVVDDFNGTKKLHNRLFEAKFWFDLITDEFCSKNLTDKETETIITALIKA